MTVTPKMIREALRREALRRKGSPGREVVVNGADDDHVVTVVMFERPMPWRVVQDVVLKAEKRK